MLMPTIAALIFTIAPAVDEVLCSINLRYETRSLGEIRVPFAGEGPSFNMPA
jgi:hypothetical protein